MRHPSPMSHQEATRTYTTNGRYDPRKSENRRQELKTQNPMKEPNHPQPKKELVDSFFKLFRK